MGFTEAIRTCLREKYFTFKGRASRSEYWFYTLFMFLVWMVLAAAFFGLGGFDAVETLEFTTMNYIFGGIALIVFVGLYIPSIAVMVRRFHDRNLSGWWVLAVFVLSNIPYVGFLVSIASLVITVLKGTDGDNRFGPDPLRVQNGAEVFA